MRNNAPPTASVILRRVTVNTELYLTRVIILSRRESFTVYRLLVGKPERYHFVDLRVDGRIILKMIFKCWDGV